MKFSGKVLVKIAVDADGADEARRTIQQEAEGIAELVASNDQVESSVKFDGSLDVHWDGEDFSLSDH